ncbi:MAG: helix-turn-helix domain-containing protein [Clostridia bacterium]|nr:helix-turn-helix domain-containing protein [Clostridia bacterium]
MLELNVIEILRKKKKSKYWLFNELNQISTMSYTNFNNIVENKTKSIKYENIEKFCNILDCEPNDLFKKVKKK